MDSKRKSDVMSHPLVINNAQFVDIFIVQTHEINTKNKKPFGKLH